MTKLRRAVQPSLTRLRHSRHLAFVIPSSIRHSSFVIPRCSHLPSTLLAVADRHGLVCPQRRQLPADACSVHQSAAAGAAAVADLGAGHRGRQPEQLADPIVFDQPRVDQRAGLSHRCGPAWPSSGRGDSGCGRRRASPARNSTSAATTNCSGSGCGGTSRRRCTTAATTSSPPARRGRCCPSSRRG